jgi:hypothetical protein
MEGQRILLKWRYHAEPAGAELKSGTRNPYSKCRRINTPPSVLSFPCHACSQMGCTFSIQTSKAAGLFENPSPNESVNNPLNLPHKDFPTPSGNQGNASASSIQGEWTPANSTSYQHPALAPQYLFCPAVDGEVVAHLAPVQWTATSFGVAIVDAGGFRVDSFDNDVADSLSDFTNSATSSKKVSVKAGTPYTVLATTYRPNTASKFTLSLCHAGGGSSGTPFPVTQPLQLLGPTTKTQHLATLAAQKAQERHKSDSTRRAAALHAMRAKAEASPNGSPLRSLWEDFVAASAKVEQLRAEVRKTGKRYSDGWSGPSAIGNNWAKGSEAVWKDMSDIAPFPTIVEDGFSPEDVQQGELGDCYFISCLSHLVADHDVLDSVFVTAETNPEGVYCVRLWVNGAWKHFFLDGTFPCSRKVHRESSDDPTHWSGAPDPKNGKFFIPVAVHSSSMNEFWPCLLEKAWARLHGSYSDIEGGRVGDNDTNSAFPLARFIPHCLPGFQEKVDLKIDTEKLWEKLLKWEGNHWLMTAGARSMTAAEATEAHKLGKANGADRDGIVRHHAFTVLRCFTFARGGTTQPLRLIKLRNPHGQGEWTGPYSDTDVKSWSPQLRAATQYSPENSGDDGIFWMPLENVLQKFDVFSVTPTVKLHNEGGGWHEAVVRGILKDGQKRSGYSQGDSNFDLFSVTLPSSSDLHVSFSLNGAQDVGEKHRKLPDCKVLVISSRSEQTLYTCNKGARNIIIEAATSLSLEPSFSPPLGKPEWEYTLTLCAAVPFEVRRTTTQGSQKMTSPSLPLLSAILPGAPPPLSPIPGNPAILPNRPLVPSPPPPSSSSSVSTSGPKPAAPPPTPPLFPIPPSFLPKPSGGNSSFPARKKTPFTAV